MRAKETFDVPGAPAEELRRSPAATAVGRLAASSGLLMTHFEYRVPGTPLETWVPPDRDDLLAESEWDRGILREQKYQSFRTDLMIGSFHPNHRAKWTAHELCHGLVGFAWRPAPSPFFLANAARLAELLPVALFYFFDEAGLNRCEAHRGFGPLFATYCRDCELAAMQPGTDAQDDASIRYLQEGKAFVGRELAAVRRGLQFGRPISSPWGNLDLCSDGLAYATAQGGRLRSPEYEAFMELAYPAGGATGCHESLESLEARLLSIMNALTGEGQAEPWPVPRELWKARDVAWRLWELAANCEREPARLLQDAAAELLQAPYDMSKAIASYQTCYDAYAVPDPEDMFAVGYDVSENLGRSVRQIAEGIASACPMTWERLSLNPATRNKLVHRFASADNWEREPLGKRFARWMTSENLENAALATFESAVNHAPPRDSLAWSLHANALRDSDYQLSSGVEIVPVDDHVLSVLGIDTGQANGDPTVLAIQREVDNEPGVLLPDRETADVLRALKAGQSPEVDAELLQSLFDQKLLIPARWYHTHQKTR